MSLPLAHAGHDLLVAGAFLVPLVLLAAFYAVAARLLKPSDEDRDR